MSSFLFIGAAAPEMQGQAFKTVLPRTEFVKIETQQGSCLSLVFL